MSRSSLRFSGMLVAALAALVLCSCADHFAPVKDYLEEYTTTAAIGAHSILTERGVDSVGVSNVPSASTALIRFLMRNPKKHALDYAIVFDDSTVQSAANPASDYGFIPVADGQSFELELHPSFLRPNEGRDISATVTITNNATSVPYDPYRVTLVCNTAPPAPRDATVMISSDNKNVICFNLDLSDDIHGDIDAIVVNGVEYPVDSVSAGMAQSISFSSGSPASVTAPSGMRAHAGSTPFVDDPATPAVYVATGDSSASPRNYLVSVRDERGLLGSVSVSSNPSKLGQVLVTDGNGQLISNLSDASLVLPSGQTTASIVLTGPTGSTVNWTCEKNGSPFETGVNVASPHTLTLAPGTYVLTAFASMDGYADSDTVTVQFKVITAITEVFVAPFNGNDTTGSGTYPYPVQTIERAVELLTNKNDPANTIHLLENVPGLAPVSHADDIVHLEFDRDTQFTIEGNMKKIDGADTRRCIYISSDSRVVKVRLKSLKINNGKSKSPLPYGGGIYFNAPTGESSLTLDNCDVWSNSVENTGQPYGGGGGVYARCGNLTLVNGSSIRDNEISSASIARGAGLCAEVSGTVAISDSSFSYNETTASDTTEGAGLYCAGASVTSPITCTIENTELRNNSGIASNTGYGGGIFAENATVTVSRTSKLQYNSANTVHHGMGGALYAYNADATFTDCEIANNKATHSSGGYSAIGYGGGICFVKNQGDFGLSLTDTNVTGNNCNITASTISGPLAGAGIYVIGTGSTPTKVSLTRGQITNNITNPTTNDFSTPEGGLGGGICLLDRVQATIEGTSVSGNFANYHTNKRGKGGGVYFDSESFADASLRILAGSSISSNTASRGMGGMGGGVYLQSGGSGKITFTLEGGSIQGNFASTRSNQTGFGGGLYAISDNSAKPLSISITGGSITQNTANTTTGMGMGGGIYSGACTSLDVSGGDISGNLSTDSGIPYGDGIFLEGAASKLTYFSLSAPVIGKNHENSRNQESLHINNSEVIATFTKDAEVNPETFVLLDNNASIKTGGYLTKDPVAKIRPSSTGLLTILTGDTTINYYKFLMNDTAYCVNANGNKSAIQRNTVSLYGDILNALGQLPYSNSEDTMLIEANIPNGAVPAYANSTITIPANAHVRIVPTGPMNLNMDWPGNFVTVGGHLLFGSPDHTTSLLYNQSTYRTGHTFNTSASSSLVLRNVRIQDAAASPTSTPSVALVNGGTSGTIVLEGFEFLETTTIKLNSNRSALLLGTGNICYFVSGSITGFTNNSNSNTGGFADLSAGAELHILSGTFSGNTLVGVSSVTGTGSLTPVGIQPQ